jgi:O-antigen ligase
MSEVLRSLIVVLFIAFAVFGFGKKTFIAMGMAEADFVLRRKAWFIITLAAFLTHNFWIFCAITAGTVLYVGKDDSNKLSLFVALLFAVPLFGTEITGLGIINYFFELNYFRLLSLLLLFPTFLSLRRSPTSATFGSLLPDKFILAFILIGLALQAPVDSATNLARTTFYSFVDVFLPYYVASRALNNAKVINDFCAAFVMATVVLAGVAVAEYLKGWLLYSSLASALGAEWGYGRYLARAGSVRAMASTGQPIVLGYVCAVAMGLYFAIQNNITTRNTRIAITIALVAGLFASVSRGPWLGGVLIAIAFVALGPKPWVALPKMALAAIACALLLLATPYSEKIVDLIPFVGNANVETIEFRNTLLENSIEVIARNPFFGSFDAMATSEMESLRAGGIIDVVNSYIALALTGGLVTLSLFVGFFVSVLLQLFLMQRKSPLNETGAIIRRALIAAILGIMLIIYTVSSITFVPIVYWLVGGLGVGVIGAVTRPTKAGSGFTGVGST